MNDISSFVISIDEFLSVMPVKYKLLRNEKNEVVFLLPAGRIYNIPAYQREIRWKESQVSRLIEDLMTTPKFLGSIMVSTLDGVKFDVIDGQQRLTILNMIIEYICKKRENGKFDRCKLVNNSISCFYELFDIDFDISSNRLTKDKQLEFRREDRLDQIVRLQKIWTQINKNLNSKSSDELSALKDNIQASKINLIVNNEGRGRISKKQCILHYLDINNKSVPLDHIDILKAYLFKDNFDLFSEKWSDIQKQISELKCHNIEYDVQNIFYHYFLCEANKKLNWTLKGLQFKFLTLNTNKTEPKYKRGQHITEVIKDYKFYEEMMNKLSRYLSFLEFLCTKQGIDEAFGMYCKKNNGEILSDVSRKNIFYLSKAIVGLKEKVPKMMLMKYYLEVLDKEQASQSEYELIYYIYYCAIVFACLDERKESKQFAALVIAKDWDKRLKVQAINYYDNKIKELWYGKKISRMGYSLETGGQELPRHIFAIRHYWKKKSNSKLEPGDSKKLCIFLSTTMERTMEHFLLNKSKKIDFEYGSEKKKGKYEYPSKLFQSFVSCPINYLVLNENENADIGNISIKEKIKLLSPKGKEIWGNDLVYSFFESAKEIFGEGKCPCDFGAIEDETEVRKQFDDYFATDFLGELQRYEEAIRMK